MAFKNLNLDNIPQELLEKHGVKPAKEEPKTLDEKLEEIVNSVPERMQKRCRDIIRKDKE